MSVVPRWPLAAIGLVLVMAAGACTDDSGVRVPAGNSPSSTPKPSASELTGGVTPTPTPSPSPSGGGAASPSPSPSAASPSPSPTPKSTAVLILPQVVQLWYPTSGQGAMGKPSSMQLTATVFMSDLSTHSAVTWTSLSPDAVNVTSTGGMVTVLASDSLSPTTVLVRATAQDGQSSAIREITIGSEGGLAVTVQ